MVLYLIIIKHTIFYKFITFTHTLTTTTYIFHRHTLNMPIYTLNTEFISIPLSTFMLTFGYLNIFVRYYF